MLFRSAGFLDTATHPYVIDFDASSHIYDIIGRHYHGQHSQIKLDIPIATAMLLAVLPYEVTGVSLEAAQHQQIGRASCRERV